VLLRYDDYGESHFIMRRENAPVPEAPQPLAMRWYEDTGVIPFDPYAGEISAEWFRFLSAPGTIGIHLRVESREPVQAWINGEPMIERGNGWFDVKRPIRTAAVIALRLVPPPGTSGGGAIPEPVRVQTNGEGVMPLGDWSEIGILNNYSGGVRYRHIFTYEEQEEDEELLLDLGNVVATCEVYVNGRQVGIRVAAPWKLNVTGCLESGENTVEIVVYNTLANHYQTIPSFYRGDPVSGLMGPVQMYRYVRHAQC
jgi:hypothetical protein